MASWKEEVQKTLESGDHMDKEYEGTYKGSFGYIAFTAKKVAVRFREGALQEDLPEAT